MEPGGTINRTLLLYVAVGKFHADPKVDIDEIDNPGQYRVGKSDGHAHTGGIVLLNVVGLPDFNLLPWAQ